MKIHVGRRTAGEAQRIVREMTLLRPGSVYKGGLAAAARPKLTPVEAPGIA